MTAAPSSRLPLLWSAQTITAMGDAIYQIALVWLILDLTGNAAVTGLVAMSAYLPALVFGLWAGVFADRHHRLPIMLFSQISQALTVAFIPLIIWKGWAYSGLVGILAFLRASFGTLFPPAFNALVPSLVPKSRLVRANSLLSTATQLAYLLGPAAAGSLLQFLSLPWMFILDCLSFLITFALLLSLRSAERARSGTAGPAPTWKDLLDGFRYFREKPALGFMMALTVINNLFIMGPAIVGMPVLVKQALQGTAADYAFVEALMALGMLIGSAVVYRYLHPLKSGTLLLVGMVLDGLTYSLFLWARSLPFVMVMIVIHGIGIPFIVISRTALIQKHAASPYHGRLFSIVHLSVVGVTALSSALTGIAAQVIDIHRVFFGIGIGAALCGVVGAFLPGLRSLE
ncbi:MAG: MFS transporter [Candidatus Neomarinimicrobiota bacterium]|nr:MAG: MFS transporter [Candidatus Neomarinimicrobiota bacterium]